MIVSPSCAYNRMKAGATARPPAFPLLPQSRTGCGPQLHRRDAFSSNTAAQRHYSGMQGCNPTQKMRCSSWPRSRTHPWTTKPYEALGPLPNSAYSYIIWPDRQEYSRVGTDISRGNKYFKKKKNRRFRGEIWLAHKSKTGWWRVVRCKWKGEETVF